MRMDERDKSIDERDKVRSRVPSARLAPVLASVLEIAALDEGQPAVPGDLEPPETRGQDQVSSTARTFRISRFKGNGF